VVTKVKMGLMRSLAVAVVQADVIPAQGMALALLEAVLCMVVVVVAAAVEGQTLVGPEERGGPTLLGVGVLAVLLAPMALLACQMLSGVVMAEGVPVATLEMLVVLGVPLVAEVVVVRQAMGAPAAQEVEAKSASGQGDDMKTKNDGTKNKQND
jgi:hypothetical protein